VAAVFDPAGRSNDVRLRLKGDLRDFPVRRSVEGPVPGHGARHRRRARIREGLADDRGDRGDLLFERNRMEITGRSGTILGTKIQNVKVGDREL
jgi:hypothetical protein